MSGLEAFLASPAVAGASLLLSGLGTIATVAGFVQQGQAQKAAGESQLAVAQYQAKLREKQALSMEQQATQELATAQRAAIEEKRQGRFVGSRAQAIAAASGGGALDPTIVDILGGLDRETETRALYAMYEGQERSRGLQYGAVLERAGAAGDVYAGQIAKQAGSRAASQSYLQAFGSGFKGAGTLAAGGSSLYGKYAAGTSPNYTIPGYAADPEFYWPSYR